MEEKIDFVITWVDEKDEEWQREARKYACSKDDIRPDRFRDWGILRYLFRSIEAHAPWVNRIYFVTCGQKPVWLNTANEKLVCVKHEDFIDARYLPTFNSCVIEDNLHRIPGLSEQFVYFNDDIIITNDVKPSDFFLEGRPLDHRQYANVWNHGDMAFRINYNCNAVIRKYFASDMPENLKKTARETLKGLVLRQKPIAGLTYDHSPTAFLKSTFTEVWDREEAYLSDVCTHRFRTGEDVSQWLFKYWQIASGDYLERSSTNGYYLLFDEKIPLVTEALNNGRYKTMCLNDTYWKMDYNANKEKLTQALETSTNTADCFQSEYQCRSDERHDELLPAD